LYPLGRFILRLPIYLSMLALPSQKGASRDILANDVVFYDM